MEESNNKGKSGDSRRYPRKEVVTNLSYRVITPLGGKGLTQNISEGGLCIVFDKEIPVGTMLELKFELPGEESVPIETFAKVIWQKEVEGQFFTGVKFGT
ncbi:MAG: hypothetical protein B1H08_02975 [Candidatus Omnitrophica bacterium 4484_171]|nr:MAG: hypothetical protein B1H08_02975 [Candidatus Omnitrophica bacterium 4484_171]